MLMVRNRLPRYGIAVLTTAGASLLAILLSPHSVRVPFALSAGAVIVSALEGGLKPGLVATALATFALGIQCWLLPLPQPPESQGEVVPLLALFVIVGLLSSYLGRQCWRAIHAVDWIQATLASFGDGLIFTDSEGNVTFMNPVAHALTGWNPQEARRRLLGHPSSREDAEARHPVERVVVRALRGEPHTAMAEPALLVSRNGVAQAVDAQAAAIRDQDGGLLGAMLVLRDVTASRQAERALRQREEQFRALAACAPIGILQMDAECRCVYANCSCQLTGGFSAAEALGDGWTRFLHPEDRARIPPAWTAAMQAGKEFACELRFQMTEPQPRWVRLRSAPMYSDVGKLIGHVGILQEIGDHKGTEEALQETRTLLSTVADACPDPLFVKDRQGRYLLTNAAGARLIGKTRTEIVGKVENQLVVADPPRRNGTGDHQLPAARPTQAGEQGEAGADGQHQYECRQLPFRDCGGQLAGLISVYRDVTQEIRLRTELAEAKEALAREVDARQRAEQALQHCQAQPQSSAEQAVQLARVTSLFQEELRARQQAEEKLREAQAALEKEIQSRLQMAEMIKSDCPQTLSSKHFDRIWRHASSEAAEAS